MSEKELRDNLDCYKRLAAKYLSAKNHFEEMYRITKMQAEGYWRCLNQRDEIIIERDKQIAEQQKEIDALKAEIGMLKMGFKSANSDSTEFTKRARLKLDSQDCNSLAILRVWLKDACNIIDQLNIFNYEIKKRYEKQIDEQQKIIERYKKACQWAYEAICIGNKEAGEKAIQLMDKITAIADKFS